MSSNKKEDSVTSGQKLGKDPVGSAAVPADPYRYDSADLNIEENLNIGEGKFGVVLLATIKSDGRRVAVKKLKEASDENRRALAKEYNSMKKLSGHQNIVSLIGITAPEPMIIMEFVNGGDLHKILKEKSASKTDKIKFALDIANGLRRVREQGFVHRDVSARNCLVRRNIDGSFGEVKLADFGLAQDVSQLPNNTLRDASTKIPFQWCGPETLSKSTWAYSSDIWSFGVTIWEIATNGEEPYGACGFDGKQLMEFLKGGDRLEIPDDAPSSFKKIIPKCWEQDPGKRCTLDEIIECLKQDLDSPEEDVGINMRTKNRTAKCNAMFVGPIFVSAPMRNCPTTIDQDRFKGNILQQAILCSRLGAQVGAVGMVGGGVTGLVRVIEMDREGVNTKGVCQKKHKETGILNVLWNADGVPDLKETPGANIYLSAVEVGQSSTELSRCKVVVASVRSKDDAARTAFKISKEAETKDKPVTTILHIVHCPEGGINKAIYDDTDIICLSLDEANKLLAPTSEKSDLDTSQSETSTSEDKDTDMDVMDVLAALISLNIKVAIILTETGLVSAYSISTETEPSSIQIPDLKIEDCSGGTDAFIGALAYFSACHEHLNWDEKIKRSCAIAAYTVGLRGIIPSYPKKEELVDLFE